jgi:hypothetical protein
LRSAQLADPGEHTIELAQNQHGLLQTIRLPTRDRLQVGKHLLESASQVGDDMVAIQARPVPYMKRSCGSADEYGPRYDLLHMPLGRQEPFPI